MFDPLMSAIVLAQENLAGAAAQATAAAPEAAAGAASAAAQQPSPLQPLIFIGIMLVVFYFLLIRPQQKRAKKHKDLVQSLKRGDTVITSSGIYGVIKAVDAQTMTLEVAPKTQIKVLRSHVGGLANPETEQQLAATAQQQA